MLSTASARHCVNDLNLLQECQVIEPTKLQGFTGDIVVTRVGKVSNPVRSLAGTIALLELVNVHYTSDAPINVLSVGQLEDDGYDLDIKGRCLKYADTIVSEIMRQGNMLVLPLVNEERQVGQAENEESQGQDKQVEAKGNEAHNGGNAEGQGNPREAQPPSPQVSPRAKQPIAEKRVPRGVQGGSYEGSAIEAALKKDISCFNGYPCACREPYYPPPISIRQLLLNGTGMEMKQGQDGVVIAAEKFVEDGKAEFWIEVKIVTRMPGGADYEDGRTGWVPAGVLKIGTFCKFGDVGVVFQ